MANQFDASAGVFTMKRLRTADAAYLAGVDRPSSLPEPIAVATGPFITGPVAGAVGAGEWWSCGAAMVVSPDIAWVLVQAEPIIRKEAATNAPQAMWIYPRGVVTNGAYFEGPPLGPGNDLTAMVAASGGTAPEITCRGTPSASLNCWIPLDPSWTAYAWDVVAVVLTAAGGGFAQNAVKLDMRQVKLIGYPVNVWDTGGLHAVAAFRGS